MASRMPDRLYNEACRYQKSQKKVRCSQHESRSKVLPLRSHSEHITSRSAPYAHYFISASARLINSLSVSRYLRSVFTCVGRHCISDVRSLMTLLASKYLAIPQTEGEGVRGDNNYYDKSPYGGVIRLTRGVKFSECYYVSASLGLYRT